MQSIGTDPCIYRQKRSRRRCKDPGHGSLQVVTEIAKRDADATIRGRGSLQVVARIGKKDVDATIRGRGSLQVAAKIGKCAVCAQ
jgi:hypothetical protein